MNHCGTQEIVTKHLILRRFRLEDAKAVYENWASDDEVTRFLMWPTHKELATSERVVKEWVDFYQEKDYYHWAIVRKENAEEPIGCIGVVDLNEKISMTHIGYCIGRKWWHMGITSEALSAVIDYLFQNIGVLRIECRFDPNNANSGAVMKKCGMVYEGTHRSADWNNQGICDAAYYAVLKSDYDNK